MTQHVLERLGPKSWRCTVCTKIWQGKPRAANCAGMLQYEWGKVPEHLAQKGQLFERKLQLAEGQKPVAVVGYDHLPLYDVHQAVPLGKIIDFKEGKYAFEELPDGFTIWRVNGLHLTVRYADTWLHVGPIKLGVYRYREALTYAAERFAEQLVFRDRDDVVDQATAMIERALSRRFYAGWQRLKALVPPEVEALSRLMWASTQGDADVLHYPELYTDTWQYLRADLLKFHACRMFARASLEGGIKDGSHEGRLRHIAEWRQRLTPTVPNKALNKTLDKLPVAISYSQITRLSTIQLQEPVTNRLHLIFVLCASDHHNWGLHEKTVISASAALIQQIGAARGQALKTMSKTRVIGELASNILDYPEPYAGDLLGLARLSQEWHERMDDSGGEMLPADTPLVLPRDVDLTALEAKGIRLLRTAGDCYQERKRMRHCVHTYASKAAKGLCYLFHVDHAVEGIDYGATVEVSPGRYVVQAHGPENQKNPACEYGVQVLGEAFGGKHVS